ncbi:hypothetical protein BDP55DRAFT_728823 [Colletotrichum godetiae]|uniref:C2H2-type domain-containing protein n=1 Tax=Colletotrichum godetiae TaxID=1209918 RepID=A0AAJ0AKF5_9PEZI|nr:uncharacterized protein BDP55DRAFT_728823 [Colletotrichum godetiae]KAK1675528.1 hypothetical protein BDP55DRAFT_728823 [Colletotrichum godetiae]
MAPPLEQSVIEALEKCSTDTNTPFDEVLRVALKVTQKMLEQADPTETAAPFASAVRPGHPVAQRALLASVSAPEAAPAQVTASVAPASTGTPAGRRVLRAALPLAMASARKQAARDSVSPTPTVGKGDDDRDEFVCEFAGCGRSYEHKGSRTRHYKVNHGGRRPRSS